jgi:predicted HTH transcriptional regulator
VALRVAIDASQRVRTLRFTGQDRARIADQIELSGPLPTWIDLAFSFVDRNLARGVAIDGPRRSDRRALPLVAAREAIVNAVLHADYSQPGGPLRVALFEDRLEVENPGLLPFGLTIEEMRTGVSRVRNRTLARVLRELGYAEQWGSGIGRMEAACHEAGLVPPAFEEIGGRFRVTLSMTPGGDLVLDPVDQAIVTVLGTNGATTAEVAAGIGKSARTARTRLLRLIERGLVVEVGTGPTDPRRRYHNTA